MYALVKIAGKQYRAEVGGKIRVNKIDCDVGSTLSIDDVMLIKSDKKLIVGDPLVKNASVTLEVLEQGLSKKIKIIKFRRRKHYMRTYGHRQDYMDVLIKSIDYK